MKSSKDQALLGKKIESIRKRLVRAGQMKWQALDKTGRPNVTQAELLEWEDWKRIVEIPKTPQDYSKVVNGRRAVSAKLAGKISACFGIPSDLLEPNVPLNDFKDYLDEDLREPDRHVPVEETRQLLEIIQKRKKAALEAGRKKNRRAESLYDSLIEGYSASPFTAVLEQLSRICLEYGRFLESTGRPDSAFAMYRRLIDDFDNRWTFEDAEDRRRFSEPVACALVEKARLLQCKGFTDDAIAVLQEAISRFGEEAEKSPSLRAHLLKATQTLRDLGLASGLIDEKEPSGPALAEGVASAETDLDYIDFLPLPQQKRLAEFRKRFVETGQAVLLLGPQIGVRSGLPDESTIWERLAEAGGLPLQPPPVLCEDIVRTHGSEWLHRHLAELLDDEAAPLSDIHQIAARIDFRAYMTTNTDRLMEWALKDAGRAHRSIFFEPDKVLLPDDKTPIVKFCGSVEHPHTLSPYFDPSRIPMEKYARVFRLLGNAGGLLAIGYRNVEGREFRTFLRGLQEQMRVNEILLVAFGENRPESDRELVADPSQCFIVDPGHEKSDFLLRIMGFLGKMGASRLERLGRRRLFRANPFPGLSPYRYRAANFHGRDRLMEEYAERIDQLPAVATFFGESGCGKTSFFSGRTRPTARKTRRPHMRRHATERRGRTGDPIGQGHFGQGREALRRF